jgi:hypothetical protein
MIEKLGIERNTSKNPVRKFRGGRVRILGVAIL